VSSLAERYSAITAALPDAVALLAVSKGRPAAAIRQLYGLGQRRFGESRLQEASAKQAELADLSDIDWHFIGRLQANKVRPVIKGFSTIHAVDSQPLAERISRIATELQLRPQLYLQLKLLPDANKGGLEPEALEAQWPSLQALPSLQWQGVMLIPPLGLSDVELQQLFCAGARWADQLGLPGRSMGMSRDWPLAVRCGSRIVRVGSSLFGAD
jgi:pyridoxal phosphate enzyme (YggS family)